MQLLELQAVLGALDLPAFTATPSGEIDFLNAAARTLGGFSAAMFAPGLANAVHPADRPVLQAAWEHATQTGERYEVTYRLTKPNDTFRWVTTVAVPLRSHDKVEGWFGFSLDATDRLRERERLEFLVRSGAELSRSLDHATTLQTVANLAVGTIADACLFDILDEHGLVGLVAYAHRDPAVASRFATAGAHLTPGEGRPRHPVMRVLRTVEPLLVPEIDADWIAANATGEEHAAFMRELEYRSLLIVPVRVDRAIFGTLTFVRSGPGAIPFDHDDLTFAEELGRRAGVAVDNARRYGRARVVARMLQVALLPDRLPEATGVEFDAVYQPATSEALIGGDWYDAFTLPDGRIVISIGDALGHGLSAAVLMSKVRQSVRAGVLLTSDLSALLRAANFTVRLEGPDALATMLVAVFDPRSRTLEFASAGHPGPMIRAADGTVVNPLAQARLPLGLDDVDRAPKLIYRLEPGSFVAFYTDGLIESTRDVIAGLARVEDAVRDVDIFAAPAPAQAIRDRVLVDGINDDVAILTLRVT